MRKTNFEKSLMALTGLTLGLTMTACGGGSTGTSVSPGSTQPPLPPVQTNSSLANLQYSETFPLASAVMSLDLTLTGQGENQTFASANISSARTLSYNANNDSFTLRIVQADVNHQEVFAPSDIDAGSSDANFTVYDKSNELLILLNPHAPLLDLEYVTLGGKSVV